MWLTPDHFERIVAMHNAAHHLAMAILQSDMYTSDTTLRDLTDKVLGLCREKPI